MISALTLAIANAFSIESPWVGIFAFIGFFISTGELIGPVLLPKHTRSAQILVGIIGLISVISILGSLVYYTMPITKGTLSVLMIIVTVAATLVGKHSESTEPETHSYKASPWIMSMYIAIFIALASWWATVLQVSIVESVRSPWLVLNPFIVLALAIAAMLAMVLLIRGHRPTASSIAIGLIFFSAVALTISMYPLGYGFDPFVHRATISHIAEFGTISPKPLYYIGQYALELVGIHIFSLPLKMLDVLLVPILSSVLLTASAWISFKTIMPKNGLPAIIAVLLMPLGAFVSTTPQALAYIFTGILLFLSLPRLFDKENAPPMFTLWLIAIAALITHPLAGIPAMIYTTLVTMATWEQGTVNRKLLVGFFAILGSIALPIVFVAQAKNSGLDINFTLSELFNLDLLGFNGFFANHFSSLYDGLYLVISNYLWILVLLAVIGAWYTKQNKTVWWSYVPIITAGVWLVNYWLLSTTLQFEFLIEYERANYAVRLLTLTAIFLVPHAGIAIAGIFSTLKSRPKILTTSLIALIGFVIVANVYSAYPRHDNYARSAGYNVAKTDIDTVYAINDIGGDEDYIVLANQAVSAAALEAFGFKKYYNGDVFYYPIPTGGELYGYYLDMTDYNPDRWRMEEAMDLAGVDLGFFIVNNYWWKANVITEHAKNEANDWFSIGEDDEVTVFIFER